MAWRLRTLRPTARAMADFVWPLLQATAAATTAWAIARHVFHDHIPFFAPIAAVIALNASRGERGLNALRLVLGVFVGIMIGELSVATLGGGYPSLIAATFTALVIARALAHAPLVLNQAAVAAILTVVSAGGEAGAHRLADALIGTSVALVCTQFLFSPEPLAMVRRAQGQAFAGIADALERTARALERNELAEPYVIDRSTLSVPTGVAELAHARRVTNRATRHSLLWRRQLGALDRENDRASTIDLLAASSLILARTALAAARPARIRLAGPVRHFSRALAQLAIEPGAASARQRAADDALSAAREFARAAGADTPHSASAASVTAARMLTEDLLTFLGVGAEEAARAIGSGANHVPVPGAPPPPSRIPFRS